MTTHGFDRRALPQDARIGTWLAPDGWPHRRFDWDPAPGAPRRGRLLFQSGRSDFLEKYLESFAHWRDRGWAVTAFDWRGQGGSGRRETESSFDPLIADLGAFLADWLAQGHGPAVLVAHSMGGYLALRLLAKDGGCGLDAVILVAPMMGLNSAPIPAPLARRIAAIARRFGLGGIAAWKDGEKLRLLGGRRQRALTGSVDRFDDAAWWKAARPELALGAPSWDWLFAAYRALADIARPGVLEKVRVPILILAAQDDRIVRMADIRAAAARLPAARLHVYPPPAAHELLRETDDIRLDAFARIDQFLAEVVQP